MRPRRFSPGTFSRRDATGGIPPVPASGLHPEYRSYGLPDTPNATDNVVGRGDLAGYAAAASRMTDGAMLASSCWW